MSAEDDLMEKIGRMIEQWRESNNDTVTPDAEIVRKLLDQLGILPGAKVELVNNKCGKGTVTVKISFQLPKPVEFISIDLVGKRKKRRRRLS